MKFLIFLVSLFLSVGMSAADNHMDMPEMCCTAKSCSPCKKIGKVYKKAEFSQKNSVHKAYKKRRVSGKKRALLKQKKALLKMIKKNRILVTGGWSNTALKANRSDCCYTVETKPQADLGLLYVRDFDEGFVGSVSGTVNGTVQVGIGTNW